MVERCNKIYNLATADQPNDTLMDDAVKRKKAKCMDIVTATIKEGGTYATPAQVRLDHKTFPNLTVSAGEERSSNYQGKKSKISWLRYGKL